MSCKTYDKQCAELAHSFLYDAIRSHDRRRLRDTPFTKQSELVDLLAKEIQQTIEDFLEAQGLET